MKKLLWPLIAFVILGCQSKPTVVKQESENEYKKNTVMVDTRSAFEYATFHVSGSVHLSTEDFLILKNPKTKKRILDPDLEQTIERLAQRGLTPQKSVLLISETADSLENKKWAWLFKQLGITDIKAISLYDYRVQNKSLVPQAEPERQTAWVLQTSKNDILKAADICFVNWSEAQCK